MTPRRHPTDAPDARPPSDGGPRVAAIIPAYNERDRVVCVLEAVSLASHVSEVLCVTDGCTDGTADRVRAWIDEHQGATSLGEAAHSDRASSGGRARVELFELHQNIGKGGAMAHGAHRTDAPILLFLDADLIGLRSEQVDALLEPMLRQNEPPADMVLGLFGAVRGGLLGWWLSWCHRAAPSITGQRAIRRDVFLSVPGLTRSRFGVEAAITRWVQNDPELRVDYVYLHAVTHPIKEEKLGPWGGARNRLRMYHDIARVLIADTAGRQATRRREQALEWLDRFNR